MKMHMNILAFFVWLGFFHTVLSQQPGIGKDQLDAPSHEVAEKFNKLRKRLAEQQSIANMHELTYDAELEKKAKAVTCDIADAVPEDPYTILPVTNNKTINEASGIALYYPLQTRVGCANLAKPCSRKGVIIYGVCIMAPFNILNYSKSDFKEGPPGSQCPNGKAPSGLCSASSSVFSVTTFLLIGISLNFMFRFE